MDREQAAVERILRTLTGLRPAETGPHPNVLIQLDLSGEGGGRWIVRLYEGAFSFTEGNTLAPTAALRMPAGQFVRMMAGEVDARELEAKGQLQVEGQGGVITALVALHVRATRGIERPAAGGMTGRQRIMAALRHQAVDRLPFTPLIDNYFLIDAPPEIPRNPIEAARFLGVDIMLRHVPVMSWSSLGFLGALGSFRPPVEFTVETQGERVIEKIRTPKGMLTGISAYTAAAGWIPHPLKHAVETEADLRLFHQALDYLEPGDLTPAYEGFTMVDQAIGDDGLATPSLNNSPLVHFVETISGLNNVYFLMQDRPEEFDEILTKLARHYLKVVAAVAQSPIQVVVTYENTSTTLISPDLFRRYCLPFLNQSAEILHRAGKIHLVHMCGKLYNLRAEIAAGLYDGITDVAPAPTGDLTLAEAAASLPGKSVMGGIDATTFTSDDEEFVRTEVSRTVADAKNYRGVLLGSGDSVPRGARVANFRIIREILEEAGGGGV